MNKLKRNKEESESNLVNSKDELSKVEGVKTRNGERVCHRVHNPEFKVRVLVSQLKNNKEEKRMEKKVEYVREHYSKEVRMSILKSIQTLKTEKDEGTSVVKGFQFKRKSQRVWTLNRSPHGNKTAREQFGRQVWQRRRVRDQGQDRGRRKHRMYKENQYVNRKEISMNTRSN